MSRRNNGAGRFFGLAAAVGAAALAVKYITDHTDFMESAEPKLNDLKESSAKTKEAAKRTYISLKEHACAKEAVGELAKSTGQMVKGAGDVAVAAGKSAVHHVKELKALYDEDPDAAKRELADNLKDMKDDLSEAVLNAADKVSELRSSARATSCVEGDEKEGCSCDCEAAEVNGDDVDPEAPTVSDDTI